MKRLDADAEVIESWKEISRYLDRDIRTLQRWEQERGLPVRRMPGGLKPGVYALKTELDAWRRNGGLHVATAEHPVQEPLTSLAVLPFVSLTGDPEDRYCADGLADEIITALSRLPGLRVTARTSSFAFRGKEEDVRGIGRRLNARAVLEGTYRRSGSRIRVTAQLVETSEGYHLWSERFDLQTGDLFTVQDEIARAVVDALRVRLVRAGAPAGSRTTSPEAYRLWLKARHHSLRHTPDEILQSRELLARTIAVDPGFARAHLGLAESYWEGAFFGIDRPCDAVAVGRPAVQKALEIDPTLGEAHAMLGIYRGLHDFDWEDAERSFQRALELAPSSSEVRTRYAAWRLEPDLRLEEARAQLNIAVELDPLSAIVHGCLGHHLIFRREFQQAAEELQLAVELEPAYWWAHVYLAASHAFQGSFDKAEGIMQKLLSVTGGCPLVIGSYAFGYGAIGDRQRAEQLRNQLLTSTSGYVPPLALAWSHLGLGEAESCLDWLEKAVEERDPQIVEFQPKPIYDGLRGHPRFKALLSAMHLDRR